MPPTAVRIMPDATIEPPYASAKNMLLFNNVDNKSFLKELFKAIYPELPQQRKNKRSKGEMICTLSRQTGRTSNFPASFIIIYTDFSINFNKLSFFPVGLKLILLMQWF